MNFNKKLGDKVCVFDDMYGKVYWYVIVGCDELVSSYIVVQLNKNLREKDLKFDKIKWDDVYDSEEEAKEAYIKELEKQKNAYIQQIDKEINEIKNSKTINKLDIPAFEKSILI
jgi:hypothetical protein